MKHISFSLTTSQVRHGFATGEILKDVTRRIGWWNVRPGELLMACEKCQGIKRGGEIVRLGVIEVVSAREEPLNAITKAEVLREGFSDGSPRGFVLMFCAANKCREDARVMRLEFKYRRDLTIEEARKNPFEHSVDESEVDSLDWEVKKVSPNE